VLQCGAVYVAGHINLLSRVVELCCGCHSDSQRVTLCCSVLQFTAVCCRTHQLLRIGLSDFCLYSNYRCFFCVKLSLPTSFARNSYAQTRFRASLHTLSDQVATSFEVGLFQMSLVIYRTVTSLCLCLSGGKVV